MITDATYPNFNNYQDFVTELYEFIFGKKGRSFHYQAVNNKDWDQVITDLIDNTANQTSISIQKAGATDRKRGQGILHIINDFPPTLAEQLNIQIDNGIIQNDSPPKIPNLYIEDNDESAGMSILEFLIEEPIIV